MDSANHPDAHDTAAFACWIITRDHHDGRQRQRFHSHDPQHSGFSEVRARIASDPQRLRFRMRKQGRTLYTGLYLGPDNRQKQREPLVMVGAPCGQCWDIEYQSGNKWERV
jgi:hypothetical protein